MSCCPSAEFYRRPWNIDHLHGHLALTPPVCCAFYCRDVPIEVCCSLSWECCRLLCRGPCECLSSLRGGAIALRARRFLPPPSSEMFLSFEHETEPDPLTYEDSCFLKHCLGAPLCRSEMIKCCGEESRMYRCSVCCCVHIYLYSGGCCFLFSEGVRKDLSEFRKEAFRYCVEVLHQEYFPQYSASVPVLKLDAPKQEVMKQSNSSGSKQTPGADSKPIGASLFESEEEDNVGCNGIFLISPGCIFRYDIKYSRRSASVYIHIRKLSPVRPIGFVRSSGAPRLRIIWTVWMLDPTYWNQNNLFRVKRHLSSSP